MAQKKRTIAPAPAAAPAAAEALVLSDDAATALKQLAKHRLRAPGDAQGYVLAAGLQRAAGLAADAEALLAAGMKKAQAAPGVAGPYAQAALLRGDWGEAARRAERARSLAPADVLGYAVGLVALLADGRTDAAEALLAEAMARSAGGLPAITAAVEPLLDSDHVAAWTALCVAASRPPESELRTRGFNAAAAGDWPAAAAAWVELRTHYPDQPTGWVHGSAALVQLGRMEEAEALLAEAMEKLNGHVSVLIGTGYLAMTREDWPLAAARWAKVRAMTPTAQDGWVHGITALHRAGDAVAVAALQAEALAKLPTNLAVLAQHAYMAMGQQDWAEALARWRHVATVFPGNAEAESHIKALLERLKG